MPESDFTLELEVRGKPVTVEGVFRQSAYTYQFLFLIDGVELIVEKDDQNEFRARTAWLPEAGGKSPDPALVKAIVEEMQQQFAN